MDQVEMTQLFRAHRDAEARRDIDAILDTFTEDCFLETVPLGLRSEGRDAARMAYVGYFTAFPDLSPEDHGMAVGENVLVAWGVLQGTSRGDWLGVAPSGGRFAVPFTNVTRFKGGRMEGESIYFDLATLCEQAGLPLNDVYLRDRDRRWSVARLSRKQLLSSAGPQNRLSPFPCINRPHRSHVRNTRRASRCSMKRAQNKPVAPQARRIGIFRFVYTPTHEDAAVPAQDSDAEAQHSVRQISPLIGRSP